MRQPKPSDIYLSVVIPAYNEEARIGRSLRSILDYLAHQSWRAEVLVVVDGSRDRTAEIARQVSGDFPDIYILDNVVNRGKGFSVRRGMLEARGQYILFSDADLSTPIEEADTLLAALQDNHEVAIASRALPTSRIAVSQPWWRQTMGRVFNWVVRRVALEGIYDSQCGFKCFPRDVARCIFPQQRTERFGFDVEVLWIALKNGYRIAQIPVTWINNPQSTVHPIRDSLWMLLDLFRIRLNDWRGYYGGIPQHRERAPEYIPANRSGSRRLPTTPSSPGSYSQTQRPGDAW